ncbi:SLC13 family permease [Azotobacter armeniacus]
MPAPFDDLSASEPGSPAPQEPAGRSTAASVGLLLGPLLLLACLLSEPPAGMSGEAWATVGLACLMATWWSTEAIPIPITSLLPILLIPALGIASLEKATAPYSNPVIFLFMGGFMLGLAMERWNLHRRIALSILVAAGSQPTRQIAGFMLATAFLSMWVSNTATTIMMLPIGLSVIGLVAERGERSEQERFAVALLLGIAYAASIGGVATLIGSPPNALLAAFLRDNHGIEVGFGSWMLFGLPVAVLMLAFSCWWMTRKGFKLSGYDSQTRLREELAGLGAMSRGEKLVAAVLLTTALCWIFQPAIGTWLPGINDTGIAMAAALALFLIPVQRKDGLFLMSWEQALKLPWGVLLLFGGGLSLAQAIRSTGLAEWIAQGLQIFASLPPLLLLGLVVLVIIFLTEITSNTATAAAFLPLLGALAASLGFAPELLAIPAAVAASYAFMLPVATPPNAIVFGTGKVRIGSMMRAGLALNLAGLLIVTLVGYFLSGVVTGN